MHPSGSRLVFQSNRRDRNWDLYTILANGSGLERLTGSPAAEWAPAWSPDGSQIAFTIARYSSEWEDIAVLHLDSSVMVRFIIRDTFELEPDWQPVQATPAS
jgi:Tol biopolymer transport system component